MKPVTDPALLAQLNGGSSGMKPVTDPALLAQLNGTGAAAPVSPVSDAVKSVPGGMLSGLASTLSASGTAGALENGDPDMASTMPTPQQTQQALEQNVTGETYKPQTGAGRVTAELASTLGNPTSYIGPAGPARAIASALSANALSQAAGAATNDNPVARLLAAAAAPTFAGGKLADLTPKTAALKQAGADGMDAFRNSGLELNATAMSPFATSQKMALDARGLDNELAPVTHGVLNKLENPGAGATVTAANLTSLRQKLGTIAKQTSDGKATPEAAAAGSVISNFDDHVANLNPSDVTKGDLASSLAMWNEARQNYAAAMRSTTFDKLSNKAEVGAAVQNSGLNLGNKERQQFATMLTNDKNARGFNDTEMAAVNKLVRGTLYSNSMRRVGNMFGGGGGIGQLLTGRTGAELGGALGFAAGGVPGAGLGALGGVALPVAGVLARRSYNNTVMKQADALGQLIRSRSPLARSMPSAPAKASPAIQRFLNLARAVQASHATQSP